MTYSARMNKRFVDLFIYLNSIGSIVHLFIETREIVKGFLPSLLSLDHRYLVSIATYLVFFSAAVFNDIKFMKFIEKEKGINDEKHLNYI